MTSAKTEWPIAHLDLGISVGGLDGLLERRSVAAEFELDIRRHDEGGGVRWEVGVVGQRLVVLLVDQLVQVQGAGRDLHVVPGVELGV